MSAEVFHHSPTMKGTGLLILAIVALIGGAVLVVFLSSARTEIKDHKKTIADQKGTIETLTQEKETLTANTTKLTQELTQAKNTITDTAERRRSAVSVIVFLA